MIRTYQSQMIVQRRSKLQLYNDILAAIRDEATHGKIKPTRIQHICNMSYDKLSKYLEELKSKGMITNPSLSVTEKGFRFLGDYDKIRAFVEKMELEYIREKKLTGK